MKPLLRRPGFGGLLFAQAQVAFTDNATKLILIGLPRWRLPATQAGRLVSLMSLFLVAPFRARFGCELLEGYGMTEASPIVSLNLAMPAGAAGADTIQQGSRERSAGRLLPGITMKLLEPQTLAECRAHSAACRPSAAATWCSVTAEPDGMPRDVSRCNAEAREINTSDSCVTVH